MDDGLKMRTMKLNDEGNRAAAVAFAVAVVAVVVVVVTVFVY